MTEFWMPGIERIETAAQGPNTIKPVAVVNHIMQGYQNTMLMWARERPYIRAKSAHFTINRKGRIVQHVAIDKQAWHSGNVQDHTWKLLRDGVNPNEYTIGIEHEGFSVDPISYGYDYLYGSSRPWPKLMVEASIEVHKWCCDTFNINPNRDTIIGHRAIDTVNRKYDPGWQWPQQRIIDELLANNLPPPINKSRAYWQVAMGRAKPIRVEGKYGIYELKVRL